MISKSGTVAFGGKVDEVDLYLSPTLMTDVPLDSPLMNEEIFGPVLPIIPVDSIQHAVDFWYYLFLFLPNKLPLVIVDPIL